LDNHRHERERRVVGCRLDWTERDDGERLISFADRPQWSGKTMKTEYDFSKGRRGQAVPTTGKTRITIYLDDEIVAAFKAESA
jgi:hypothetical protein